MRADIEGKRTQLAEARAEAQALARETELAERRTGRDRRRTPGVDRAARRRAGADRDASKRAAAKPTTERAALADTPKIFAEKRRGLIDQIENAEAERAAAAADRLAEAENVLAEADRAMRAALEALGAAREEAARAEERHESAKRRLTDIAHEIRDRLEVEPDAVAGLAGITEGETLPDVAEHRSANSKSCGAIASGSARSTCAPRKNCARSRSSTASSPPSATIWSRRSSGCARAS